MMPERWQRELRSLRSIQPLPDLWERAQQGRDREPPRGDRARRVTTVAVAVLVAVSATFGLIRAFRSGPTPHGFATHTGLYTDPRFGWSIQYLGGMQVGHFESAGMFTSDGI